MQHEPLLPLPQIERGFFARHAHDFVLALAFLTRFARKDAVPMAEHGAALVWFPLVGLFLGAFAALVNWLAAEMVLPPILTATLAVVALAWLTRCRAEDALADFVDGVAGGNNPQARLAIMRDHSLGTTGMMALLTVLLVKINAVANLTTTEMVFASWMVAACLSRAMMPAVAAWLPPADAEPTSQPIGDPSGAVVLISLALGIVATLLLLEPTEAALALGAAFGSALCVALYAQKKIGGGNADVLGALQQISEATILTLLVAAQVQFE